MSFRSQLRTVLIRAASLLGADEVALRLQNRCAHGVVVAIHETPSVLEDRFREQIEWVSRHFTICTLNGFIEQFRNPQPRAELKPPLLFTFDDGRESNYQVAAPLLESFGVRGLFFIVPAFAECSSREAFDFYRSRINPGAPLTDEKVKDWKPMTPAQVAELAARGHAIGNHTLTHARLAGLPPEELEQEIADGARKLALWINQPVESFAWTFGWDAIDASALKVIHRHHRYCFAPCAGTIDARCGPPGLLWRREIEVNYAPAEYRFLYSGLADLWWSTRRRRLRKMLQVSNSNHR